MAERSKLLYIYVKDELRPSSDQSRGSSQGSLPGPEGRRGVLPRYNRSILSSTLQLMGCKTRHAFKISNRAFEILVDDLSVTTKVASRNGTGFGNLKFTKSMPAGLDILDRLHVEDRSVSLASEYDAHRHDLGSQTQNEFNSRDASGSDKGVEEKKLDQAGKLELESRISPEVITGRSEPSGPLTGRLQSETPGWADLGRSPGVENGSNGVARLDRLQHGKEQLVGSERDRLENNARPLGDTDELASGFTKQEVPITAARLQKRNGSAGAPESQNDRLPQRSARGTVQISRKKFLDVVCQALAEYQYVGPNQRYDLMIACSVRERRTSVTVLLCGTSGCGKSTLSSLLASRLDITTVVSTDSIRHMMRSFVDEKDSPLLWASTYHAGECLDPAAVAEARAKKRTAQPHSLTSSTRSLSWPAGTGQETMAQDEAHCDNRDLAEGGPLTTGGQDQRGKGHVPEDRMESSGARRSCRRSFEVERGGASRGLMEQNGRLSEGQKKNKRLAELGITEKELTVQGFKAQSEMVIDSLDRLITRWEERRESVIVEGVHLSLNFVMTLMKKHPSIIPFMIYIGDEAKHLERFAVRAKYMTLDPARNKYVKYIRNIRTIQDYLSKRADKHLVPKVNNTNVDKSVAAIHATVFACLRRRAAGEALYDSMQNTVHVVQEEYQNQYAASGLSSKGMFQLIQLQGSHRSTNVLVHADGDVTKTWPVPVENTGGVILHPRNSFYLPSSSAMSGSATATGSGWHVVPKRVPQEAEPSVAGRSEGYSQGGWTGSLAVASSSNGEALGLRSQAGKASGPKGVLGARTTNRSSLTSQLHSAIDSAPRPSDASGSTAGVLPQLSCLVIESPADVETVSGASLAGTPSEQVSGGTKAAMSGSSSTATASHGVASSSTTPMFIPGLAGAGSPIHVRFGGHGLAMWGTELVPSSTYSSSTEGTSAGGAWLGAGSSSGTPTDSGSGGRGQRVAAGQEYLDTEPVAMSDSEGEEREEDSGSSDEEAEGRTERVRDEEEEGSVDENESFMHSDEEQEGLRSGDEHDDEGGWFDGGEDGAANDDEDDDEFYNWGPFAQGRSVERLRFLPRKNSMDDSSVIRRVSDPGFALGLGPEPRHRMGTRLDKSTVESSSKILPSAWARGGKGLSPTRRLYKSMSTSALHERPRRRLSDGPRGLSPAHPAQRIGNPTLTSDSTIPGPHHASVRQSRRGLLSKVVDHWQAAPFREDVLLKNGVEKGEGGESALGGRRASIGVAGCSHAEHQNKERSSNHNEGTRLNGTLKEVALAVSMSSPTRSLVNR